MKSMHVWVLGAALWLAACDADFYRPVSVADLPASIRVYVDQTYPGITIRSAWRDDDGYEVRLSNGIELEFDLSGTFLYADDDGDGSGYVPVAEQDLPQAIRDHIAANYPGSTIRWAKRDDDGYEVKLSNGTELEFTLAGQLIRAYPDDDGDDDDDDDGDSYVPVPVSALPQAIRAYIEANYPGLGIASAQRDDDGYEVFLSNGLELNFSLDGTFLYAG